MIYSKKYGRSFNSRSELQRYDNRIRRSRPILPWFGIRDAPYSDEYKRSRASGEKIHWAYVWVPSLILSLLWVFLTSK